MFFALTLAISSGFDLFGTAIAAPAPQQALPAAIPVPSTPSIATTPNGKVSIWTPPVNASWQIVLGSPLKLPTTAISITPDVEIFDIDMFGNPASTISTLHSLNKKVICYFSAGSYEPGRPDSGSFLPSDLGNNMANWPDEKWLDIRSLNVQKIMMGRIALAAQKGCDALDPDNMDGYNNDNGLGLTQQDTINYMTFLSAKAQALGMSIGLKNSIEVLPTVKNFVHFAVNEQCVQFKECQAYSSMVNSGKGVFNIEYPAAGIQNVKQSKVDQLCNTADAVGMSGLNIVLKNYALGGGVRMCDNSFYNTPTSG